MHVIYNTQLNKKNLKYLGFTFTHSVILLKF